MKNLYFSIKDCDEYGTYSRFFVDGEIRKKMFFQTIFLKGKGNKLRIRLYNAIIILDNNPFNDPITSLDDPNTHIDDPFLELRDLYRLHIGSNYGGG